MVCFLWMITQASVILLGGEYWPRIIQFWTTLIPFRPLQAIFFYFYFYFFLRPTETKNKKPHKEVATCNTSLSMREKMFAACRTCIQPPTPTAIIHICKQSHISIHNYHLVSESLNYRDCMRVSIYFLEMDYEKICLITKLQCGSKYDKYPTAVITKTFRMDRIMPD